MATKYLAEINGDIVDRVKSFTVEKNLTQYSGKFNMVVSDPSNTLYDSVTSGDTVRAISRLSQGLSAYYKLDETWGTIAIDSAGTNDGTIVNGTRVSVKYGTGIDFVGDGYISISNPITDYSEWAISFWGSIDDVSSQETSVNQTFVNFYADANNGISIRNNAGKIEAIIEEAGTDYSVITDNVVLTDDTLVNIVVTYSSNVAKIYVDGLLVDASTTTGTVAATNLIGAYTSTTGRMSGQLDNIRIYERFLYAGEDSDIYNWEEPYDLLFGGYVEKIERDKAQNYTLYINGGDYTTRLNDIIVLAQIYNNREYSVIIRDLMNRYVIDSNVIDKCDLTTNWTATNGTLTLETGDDANDNMIARLGDGCLKIVPTGTSVTLYKTMSGTKDFVTTDYVTMYFYVEDASKLSGLSLDIGQDNTNYYNIAQPRSSTAELVDGWNYIEFDMRYKTTGAGTPSLSLIDYYNLNITLSDTSNTIYVDDIRLTNHGSSDLTLSNVQRTDYYTDIKFKNVSVFDSIRKVCDLRPNTYDFYVDINRVLNFGVFGSIDSGQTLQRGVNVLKSEFWDDDTKLYNKVTVYGAKQEFNLTETFDGDGTTEEFVLKYEPITQTVSVGGVEKQGYVRGMSPTEYDYRVDKENRIIEFNTAPGSGTDNISVDYTYGVPIIVQRQDDTSIADYKLRETKIENEFLLTKADVRVVATEFIDTWAYPILNAKYTIRVNPFFDIGENVSVIDEKYFGDSTARNFGVVSLKHTLIGGRSGTELNLTQITKSMEMYLQDIFSRLNALEESDKGDRDILARLLFFSDTLGTEDDPSSNLSITTRSIAGETLIWGNSYFGIWGTYKWGNTASQSFILGNVLAAVLGTSKLGNNTSAYGSNLVTNPSD